MNIKAVDVLMLVLALAGVAAVWPAILQVISV